MRVPNEPAFDLLPGGTVSIYDGPAIWITNEGEESNCQVTATFSWAAGTILRLESLEGIDENTLYDMGGVLRLPNGAENDSLLFIDHETAVLGRWEVGDVDAPLDEIVLNVCNFVPYLEVSTNGSPPVVELVDQEWVITLVQLADARDRLQQRKSTGGGTVTHVAVLRTIEGSSFSWNQAKDVMIGFGHFLRWAAGDRVPVLLPVGFNSGRRLIEHWGDPQRSLGKSALRWFSAHHPETLAETWPGFIERWSDLRWREGLTVATELFSVAHHGLPLEIRILLSQSALEVISWQWLTLVDGLEETTIDDKNADWRIRRMLNGIGVPIEIPASLGALTTMADGQDGPKTLAIIRNLVSHPKSGRGIMGLDHDAKIDAWRLSLWYLELAFMKLCGWDGPYLDRTRPLPLHEGDVSFPPWT
jgi:hypothetical protein